MMAIVSTRCADHEQRRARAPLPTASECAVGIRLQHGPAERESMETSSRGRRGRATAGKRAALPGKTPQGRISRSRPNRNGRSGAESKRSVTQPARKGDATPLRVSSDLRLASVVEILETDEDLRGLVALDVFAQQIIQLRPLPGMSPLGHKRQPWTDSQDAALAAWLQAERGMHVSSRLTREAVLVVASRHKRDPLRRYLRSLEWDGTPRIDRWLATYLGATDDDYTRAIGPKFLIAAVARGLAAGAKVDTVLVLEGAQGIGKSSVVAILGGRWSTDDLRDFNSKDSLQQLRGTWFVELPDLEAFRHSRTSRVNSFLTRRVDRYRPPYAYHASDFPRRCVFVATTNDAEYLYDPTGARRYWPVRCGKIRLRRLARDRDQLFAEAVARYQADETWWLSQTEQELAQHEQDLRHANDEWEAPITAFVRGREEVTSNEILEDAIGLPLSACSSRAHSRVVQVLTRLGYRPSRRRRGGHRPRIYVLGPDRG